MQTQQRAYDPIRNYSRYRKRLIGFIALGLAVAVAAVTVYGSWWLRQGRPELKEAYRELVLEQQRTATAIPPEDPAYQVYTPDNRLAKLEEDSTCYLTEAWNMPVLDGDAEAFPLYAAFAQHCYANIAQIDAYGGSTDPLTCTGGASAFDKLMDGSVDVYFGEELTTDQRTKLSTAELPTRSIPLATHVLVFYVHEDNPVDGLTQEQLRDILAGKYTNWSQLGGLNLPLLAFQQPATSSAHTWMVKKLMEDIPVAEPLTVRWRDDAGQLQSAQAVYQNKLSSIGYAWLDELTAEASLEEQHIKVLAVDGETPTERKIAACRYPLLYTVYAHACTSRGKGTLSSLLTWLESSQAQDLIRLSHWRLYAPRPAGLQ